MTFQEVPFIVPASVTLQRHRAFQFDHGPRVLIVEDPSCDMPACAASMRVGQNQDPVDFPGLAHFCEHMLFMGTEKYPKESEYDLFVTRNGGHSNAWTANDSTTFYFCVAHRTTSTSSPTSSSSEVADRSQPNGNPSSPPDTKEEEKGDVFLMALDRFLEFFMAPSFDPSAVERELQAVHSEDEKNHMVEYWRVDEIIRAMTDSRHPRHRYGNGNYTTLWTEPQSRGLHVRDALLQFYQTYYTADAFALVIHSSITAEQILPLLSQQLQRLKPAATSAVAVPASARNTGFLPLEDAPFGVYTPSLRGKWMNIKSIQKSKSVRVAWPYASPVATTRHLNVSAYASHILGHECDVSVLGVLKQLGYATKLVGGEASAVDDDFGEFYVTVELTNLGLSHILDVLDVIFEGIAVILAPGKVLPHIDDSNRQESRLSFEMSEVASSVNHASHLVPLLHESKHVPFTNVWEESSCILAPPSDELRAEMFRFVEDVLRVDNCWFSLRWEEFAADGGSGQREEEGTNVPDQAPRNPLFHTLPEFCQHDCNEHTAFHKTSYSLWTVPSEILERFAERRRATTGSARRYPTLSLPPTNPFIATEFAIAPFPPTVSARLSSTTTDAPATPAETSSAATTTATPSETPLLDSLGQPFCFHSEYGTTYATPAQEHLPIAKTAIVLLLESDVAYANPLNRFFVRIVVQMAKHALTEALYFGELASFDVDLDMQQGGPLVRCTGPTQHSADFFLQLVEPLCSATVLQSTAAQFQTYLEASLSAIAQQASRQPHEHAMERFTHAASVQHYTFQDILAAVQQVCGKETLSVSTFLSSLSAQDSETLYTAYKTFIDQFLSKLAFELLVTGNVAYPVEESLRTSLVAPLEALLKAANVSPLVVEPRNNKSNGQPSTTTPLAQQQQDPHHRLYLDAAPLQCSGGLLVQEFPPFLPSNPNSCALWSVDLGPYSPSLAMHADCFAKLTSSLFFNALRTTETLGYVVFLRAVKARSHVYLLFGVQSAIDLPTASVEGDSGSSLAMYLFSRIVAFVDALDEAVPRLFTASAVQGTVEAAYTAYCEEKKSVRECMTHMYLQLTHPWGFEGRQVEKEVLQKSIELLSSATSSASAVEECVWAEASPPACISVSSMVQFVRHFLSHKWSQKDGALTTTTALCSSANGTKENHDSAEANEPTPSLSSTDVRTGFTNGLLVLIHNNKNGSTNTTKKTTWGRAELITNGEESAEVGGGGGQKGTKNIAWAVLPKVESKNKKEEEEEGEAVDDGNDEEEEDELQTNNGSSGSEFLALPTYRSLNRAKVVTLVSR